MGLDHSNYYLGPFIVNNQKCDQIRFFDSNMYTNMVVHLLQK